MSLEREVLPKRAEDRQEALRAFGIAEATHAALADKHAIEAWLRLLFGRGSWSLMRVGAAARYCQAAVRHSAAMNGRLYVQRMRTFDPHRPFAFPKSRHSIVGQGHDRALSNQASRRSSEKIVKRLNFGMSDRNLSDFRLHLFKSPSVPVKQLVRISNGFYCPFP